MIRGDPQRGSSVAAKRILFVLPRIVSGGVERVTLNLIRMFLDSGDECILALRRRQGEFLAEADALVEVRALAPDHIGQFVPALTTLVRQWRPTHVVTAFPDIGLLTWLALRRARRRIPHVHGVHDTHGYTVARPGMSGTLRHALFNGMARVLYRLVDRVVSVSDGARDEVLARFGIPASRIVTIYNPVIAPERLAPRTTRDLRDHDDTTPVRIVALGRLARQKGYDVLVDALQRVRTTRPWTVHVHGEGPERAALEASIASASLQDRVLLEGFTAAPFEALARGDVFVLPSRHEGLPTVLIEALASQAQIVATDCPHGPREILDGGTFGALVPTEDPEAFARALESTISGQAWCGREALRRRAADFSVEASHAKWNALFDEIDAQLRVNDRDREDPGRAATP
jgi:glycosyltransferase involved in cell wall biosynthesis